MQEVHYNIGAPVWVSNAKDLISILASFDQPSRSERHDGSLRSLSQSKQGTPLSADPPISKGNPNTMTLLAFAGLLGLNLAGWSSLHNGVYNARLLHAHTAKNPLFTLITPKSPRTTGSRLGIVHCVLIILPRSQWMDEHGCHTSHAECLGEDINTMPMYVFDSYFYQAQFLGNRSTTTFISRSRKHAHTLHAFGGGVVPNDTTLQEVKMLVPFSHPMQPLRDSEQQYDIDGAYSVSLTCDDAALYRNSMSWAGGGRRFIETQHSSGCIMSCASKNVRYNTSSSCGRCSVLEVGTATVAAYPISRRTDVSSDPLQARLLALHYMHNWVYRTR